MTATKLLAILVIGVMAFLLLTAWIHASASYIAAFILVALIWVFLVPKEIKEDPDKGQSDK